MPMTLQEATAKVAKLYRQLAGRRSSIQELDRYYKGEQPLAYASREWKDFHKGRFGSFSDNWCGVVANSPSERLRVNGFRLGDDNDPISDDERGLVRAWDLNDMDAQSSQGFLQSIIAKRSAVLVWGDDDDQPILTWEHPAQVIVEYDIDNPRRRVAALKSWMDCDDEFATLYTPDEVWKLQRKVTDGAVTAGSTQSGLIIAGVAGAADDPGGWVEREISGEPNPVPNPLEVVPIIEFPNRPMLGGEPLSDIAGTMSMQNAVNLLWAYLFGAADYASMPARVIMGQEPPKIPVLDDAGQKIGEAPVEPEKLKQGRLLWLTGEKANIGQFEAAKLDVFTDVINVGVKHIAAQTRTPVHYIVGELQNVNGETLLAGETGLVKKVEEIQLFFGPAVREVYRLIAKVQGRDGLAEKCRTGRVMWANAETRTQAQQADAALKDRQIGFPLAWIAEKRYGLTQVEIAALMDLVDAEATDPSLERAIGALDGGTGAP